MSINNVKAAAKYAVSSVIPGASIANLIYDVAVASINKSKEIAEKGNPEELKLEAERLKLESRIAEYQARIAQEVAIARRIENALEVEIEEFYDTSGEGSLGVNVKDGSAGASGSGRKVTSRVYRFKGFASNDEVEQKQLSQESE
ncbi:hypothetical protein [Paenibacillus cymbidii]|uniref:hypothetical protein n=1 Tax=Paenibacillus cymbidii TaxID=1639034 RepID=UPI001080869D|nr:hypothetical protein [Paenibacillus cymbidii]